VAFTDDDARVDSEWLQSLLVHFTDPTVAVVTGITMPLELESEAQLCFELTNGFGRGFVRQRFDSSIQNPLAAGVLGAGANMAIRRSVLEEIGFFDESLDCGTPTRSGGDQEFFYRVLAHGHRIVYDPSALVWHRHRRDWTDLRSTIFGYGVGVFAWWTRALMRERELSLFRMAPGWFLKYHVRNLFRALLRKPHSLPLDLALAELCGALLGPLNYFRSRRLVKKQEKTRMGEKAKTLTETGTNPAVMREEKS
jgi:GT2 family glycosyltransferase